MSCRRLGGLARLDEVEIPLNLVHPKYTTTPVPRGSALSPPAAFRSAPRQQRVEQSEPFPRAGRFDIVLITPLAKIRLQLVSHY